ncbi:MAG: hypothetical protein J0L99_20620 [Chitinophagales bacterium]|nr:hypothetical protein [Chitinophagales bacterium]
MPSTPFFYKKTPTTMRFLNLCFTLLLPLALAFTALSGCEKEENDLPPYVPPPTVDYNVLPPATQEGLNTFGCKVNGKVWVPRVQLYWSILRPIDANVSEKNGTGGGAITCRLVAPDQKLDEWMSMYIGDSFFQTGKYCAISDGCYLLYHSSDNKQYSSIYNANADNCVTITRIDSAANIISGTFEFIVYKDSVNLNNKIEITEGRFDLKYSSE